MILLVWMLLYPLVAAADLTIRVRIEEMDTGRHNLGHVLTYVLGIGIFLTLTVLRYV